MIQYKTITKLLERNINDYSYLIYLALIIALISWIDRHYINILASDSIASLKKRIFGEAIDSDWKSINTNPLTINNLYSSIDSLDSLNNMFLFDITPGIVQFIITMIVLYRIDKKIMLSGIGIIASMVLTGLYFNGRTDKYISAKNREQHKITDYYHNAGIIKYLNKEAVIKEKFNSLIDNTTKYHSEYLKNKQYLNISQFIIINIGIFIIIYMTYRYNITDTNSVLIYTILSSLLYKTLDIIYKFNTIENCLKDIQSLNLSDHKKDIDHFKSMNLKINKGIIEFKNVNYSDLFTNFNLKISENDKIAFIGPSGYGKSTLIKLLYRFFDLDSGNILIDNHDITKYTKSSLRSAMSIVTQDIYIFDDSVYNNIVIGNPEISQVQLLEILTDIGLDLDLNMPVGLRGYKLSGGEKKKIALARALIANKKILILDEATTELDDINKQRIWTNLSKYTDNKTVIVITHEYDIIKKYFIFTKVHNF